MPEEYVRKHSLIVTLSCVIGWFASLAMPAIVSSGSHHGWMGFEVLGMGWLALIILDPRWYANPLFAWVAIQNLRKRRSGKSATVAIVLATASVVVPVVFFLGGGTGIPAHLAVGGYVWALSIVACCAFNLRFLKRHIAADAEESDASS